MFRGPPAVIQWRTMRAIALAVLVLAACGGTEVVGDPVPFQSVRCDGSVVSWCSTATTCAASFDCHDYEQYVTPTTCYYCPRAGTSPERAGCGTPPAGCH